MSSLSKVNALLDAALSAAQNFYAHLQEFREKESTRKPPRTGTRGSSADARENSVVLQEKLRAAISYLQALDKAANWIEAQSRAAAEDVTAADWGEFLVRFSAT